MGRKDKKTEENTAFEVLLRNTSGVNPGIETVYDPPGDLPGNCNQSTANLSVRSSVCDILLM